MNAIYKVVSSSLNEVAERVYTIRNALTGSVVTELQSAAVQALRDANPDNGLPVGAGTSFTPTSGFLYLPRLGRMDWAVPHLTDESTYVTLRDELRGIKVMSAEELILSTPDGLEARMLVNSPSYTPPSGGVERLQKIAILLRLSGMDPFTARYLVAHSFDTLSSISGNSGAGLKTAIEAHVTAGYPSALSDARPWNAWRRIARRRAPTRPRGTGGIAVAPIPLTLKDVEAQLATWTAEKVSSKRSSGERSSADAVAFCLETLRELLTAHIALAHGRGNAAHESYIRLHALVGAKAVERGITSDDKQARGPSIETVAELSAALLALIDPDDGDSVRTAFGVRSPPLGDGLHSLKFDHVISTAVTAIEAEVRPSGKTSRVDDLGPRGGRALDLHIESSNLGAITGKFTDSITTSNTTARIRDYTIDDSALMRQNVRSVPISQLSSPQWSAVRSGIRLDDIADAAKLVSLSSPASNHTNSAATAAFPGMDFSSLDTVFERFVGHTRTRRGTIRYLSLSSGYANRWCTEYLDAIITSGDDAELEVRAVDFADPARLLFMLPLLWSVHVRLGFARALDMQGMAGHASAMRSMARIGSNRTATGGGSWFLGTLEDLVEEGNTGSKFEDIDCGAQYVNGLLSEGLKLGNRLADRDYQAGRYNLAWSRYRRVMKVAEVCSGSQASTFLANIDAVRDDLKTRIQADDPTLHAESVLEYIVEVATDIFDPLYGDGVLLPETAWLATDAMVESAATFVRQPDADSARVRFYTDPDKNLLGIDVPEDLAASTRNSMFEPQRDPLPATLVVDDADAILCEAAHAAKCARQIMLGLNWLGFSPDYVPVWRYAYLREQARYYATRADYLQQRAFAILTQLESRTIEELQAQNQAEIASEQVDLARDKAQMARDQLDASRAAVKQAQVGVGLAIGSSLIQAVGIATGVGSVVSAVGVVGGTISSVSSGLRAAATVAKPAASTLGQVSSAASGIAGAVNQLTVAQSNLTLAEDGMTIAAEELGLAQLQASQLANLAAELEAQQTSAENLSRLLAAIEPVSRAYVQMGNRLAWLAQRAYELETRRTVTFIRMAYDIQGDASDLTGRFASAAALLADVDALDHARMTATTARTQLIRATFALSEFDPAALEGLRNSGSTAVRISSQALDERFPGLYLHSLRRVELEFDGLVPLGGFSATLGVGARSFVRVPFAADYIDDASYLEEDWAYPSSSYPIDVNAETPPAYVLKPVYLPRFRQIISEYKAASDSVVLSLPEGALDAFEHLGLDTTFTIDIPRPGNAVAFTNIADARLVVYFSAYHDQALADRQKEALGSARVSRSMRIPASQFAANALSDLRIGPSDTRFRDVRILPFAIDASTFPPGTRDHVVQNVMIAVIDSSGAELPLRLLATAHPATAAATITWSDADTDGLAYSAVGDTDIVYDSETLHESRTGDFAELDTFVGAIDGGTTENVIGTWALKFVPEEATTRCLLDDDGDVVSENGNALSIPSGGSATLTTGSWKHVELTAHVKVPDSTTLTVRARHGGSHAVYAQLTTATVALTDGTITPTSSTSPLLADKWSVVVLRIVGTTASISVDGVVLGEISGLTVAAGSVQLSSSGGTSLVEDVRVTRLRHDGTALEDVVVETFETLDDWTPAGSAALASSSHNILDLASIEDIVLIVDYTADIDYPEEA